MLKDLIIKNRSYRGYDAERKVSTEELREMVDCVRLSPSSMNQQPLKFVIVNEDEKVNKVTELIKLAGLHREWGLPLPGTEPQAYIIICYDEEVIKFNNQFIRDVGIAGTVITLAATEMGLNGCMVGAFSAKKVQETFNLPETLKPQLVVALGRGIENISITDVKEDGDIGYYRDEEGNHFVPKRSLDELIIEV